MTCRTIYQIAVWGIFGMLSACNLDRIDDSNGGNPTGCDMPANFKFEYSFGGGILDSATSILKLSDGEYFITGYTQKQADRMLLYRTNLCHDTLLYLSSGDNVNTTIGSAVCPALNGGVIAAGTQSGFLDTRGYVVQVNDAGVITDSWNDDVEKGLIIRDILPSSANGYIIAGGAIVEGGFGDQEQGFIGFLDAGLNLVDHIYWTSTFGAGIQEAVQLPGGAIIGIGSGWVGFGYRIYFYKTNNAGANLDFKSLSFSTIGGDNNVHGDAIALSGDGNVVLAGHYRLLGFGNTTTFLKKIDPDGNLIWEFDYANSSTNIIGDHIPFAVIHTSDGGFLVVGNHKVNTANQDIFLLKVDANGVYQWDRSLGGADMDYANDVIQESDGGYVITGFTKSFNSIGESGRVYLIKTDNTGKIN